MNTAIVYQHYLTTSVGQTFVYLFCIIICHCCWKYKLNYILAIILWPECALSCSQDTYQSRNEQTLFYSERAEVIALEMLRCCIRASVLGSYLVQWPNLVF